MYDLTNIFEVFLPQLLTYPNPTDPLNGEAAALQMREPERYRQKVVEYVQKYAKPEDFLSARSNDRGGTSVNQRENNVADNGGDDDDDSNFTMSDSDDDQNDIGISIPAPASLSEPRAASSAIPIGDDGLGGARSLGTDASGNSTRAGSSSGRNGVWSR